MVEAVPKRAAIGAFNRLSGPLTMYIQGFASRGDSRMLKALAGLALMVSAAPAWAASQPTDFGVRTVTGDAAVASEPAVIATGSMALKFAIPAASVVTLREPSRVCPSP